MWMVILHLVQQNGDDTKIGICDDDGNDHDDDGNDHDDKGG